MDGKEGNWKLCTYNELNGSMILYSSPRMIVTEDGGGSPALDRKENIA